MQPQADGLGEGLFGREARRQIGLAARLDPGPALAEDSQLMRAQHFLGKALAAARQRGADAADVADVGADAVDHGKAMTSLSMAWPSSMKWVWPAI